MTLIKWKKPSENGLNNQIVYHSPFQGLMENFFNDNFFGREYASFVPAINVSEEADKFNLELSAPGFDKNDFRIELDKGVLCISGEHKVEAESIDAKYENGILKLVLPKKEEKIKSSRSISIA